MRRRRQPFRFTSPWQPPRPARWPSAPAQHWLDKHEAERDKLDDELKRRIECAGVLAREHKEV
jgi:hypothetical protein